MGFAQVWDRFEQVYEPECCKICQFYRLRRRDAYLHVGVKRSWCATLEERPLDRGRISNDSDKYSQKGQIVCVLVELTLCEVNACGNAFDHRNPQIPSWDRPSDRPAEPARPDPLQTTAR